MNNQNITFKEKLDLAFQEKGWDIVSEAYYNLDYVPFMNIIEECLKDENIVPLKEVKIDNCPAKPEDRGRIKEAAKKYGKLRNELDYGQLYCNSVDSFIAGAKWQAERMYSEEEVLQMINLARKICSIDGNIDLDNAALQGNLEGFSMKYTISEMFKQFKKK